MLRNMIKLLSFCFLSRLAPMTMLNWISTSMENTCIVLWQEWREQFTQFFMVGRIPIWGWINLSISCISSGLHPHMKSMGNCMSGSSRPFDKGGPSLQNKFFWPFRLQFGLKIRWDIGGGPPRPLPWIRLWLPGKAYNEQPLMPFCVHPFCWFNSPNTVCLSLPRVCWVILKIIIWDLFLWKVCFTVTIDGSGDHNIVT